LHEYIGSLVARHWNLPKAVVTTMENHHDIDFSTNNPYNYTLSAVINLADTFARILGKGRWIGEGDIFDLKSANILELQEDDETIDFLNAVPGLIE